MDKIRICLSAYLNEDKRRLDTLYCCIYSLLSQTYQNFEIFIHHDGTIDDIELPMKIESISNKIKFIESLPHKKCWGHFHRRPTAMIEPHTDWVVFTNDDNYYMPVFLEKMLYTAKQNNAGMVYCDVIHNYENYNVSESSLRLNGGSLDMGAFMTRMDIIKETEWDNFEHAADWHYVQKIAAKTNCIKAPGILFVHN
jgi:glycosyltransferase involved in cell wall biosynthesis